MSDSPPAGWYADPHSPLAERYWDGGTWSDQTRPRAVPQSDNTGVNSALHYVVPVGRGWKAVVAPYLSLVGVLLAPLALAGVILGVLALRERDKGHGTGRAIFAIVVGAVAVLAWGFVFFMNL